MIAYDAISTDAIAAFKTSLNENVFMPVVNILHARAIAANLEAYFATTQAAAILWANDNTAMKPLVSFTESVANPDEPIYPAWRFAEDADTQGRGEGDMIAGGYTVAFELMITAKDPQTAITNARIYAKAFTAMIGNCPNDVLVDGSGIGEGNLAHTNIDVIFQSMQADESRKRFLQTVVLRTDFIYSAGLHAEN